MDADCKTQDLHKALLLSIFLGHFYIPVVSTYCNSECREKAIAISLGSKSKNVKGHLDRILHYLKKAQQKQQSIFIMQQSFH